MLRKIQHEEEDPVQVLTNLMQVLQGHKNSAELERDHFNKNKSEKRSSEILKRQDLDFDKDFGDYKSHAQTIKLCRENIESIDKELKDMMTSFRNRHYVMISSTPGLLEHCQATRQESMKIVVHLDDVMKDPGMFNVYEVFDMLGNLVTFLDNWCFVIDQMIERLNNAGQYHLDE